jgi:hypothetical protein
VLKREGQDVQMGTKKLGVLCVFSEVLVLKREGQDVQMGTKKLGVLCVFSEVLVFKRRDTMYRWARRNWVFCMCFQKTNFYSV